MDAAMTGPAQRMTDFMAPFLTRNASVRCSVTSAAGRHGRRRRPSTPRRCRSRSRATRREVTPVSSHTITAQASHGTTRAGCDVPRVTPAAGAAATRRARSRNTAPAPRRWRGSPAARTCPMAARRERQDRLHDDRGVRRAMCRVDGRQRARQETVARQREQHARHRQRHAAEIAERRHRRAGEQRAIAPSRPATARRHRRAAPRWPGRSSPSMPCATTCSAM